MSDYVIATVSTADIENTWMKEHAVPFISYTFVINEQIYQDDCKEETQAMVYHEMHEGNQPSTSQISEFAYEEFFRELLDTGKDVIFVDMSRAISNSINNAEEAMRQVKEEYPNQRFHFVDSYSITGGLAMIVKRMVKMHEEGKSFDEVVAWAEDVKQKVIHRFIVDDLQWLRRGGRLSNASAIVGTLLAIKPLLYVKEDGSLYAFDKVRGHKKAVHALIQSMHDDFDETTTPEEVFIMQSDCLEDAEACKTMIQEEFPQCENISIHSLGPVIGAHVGPGLIGIVYIGKNRIM